MTKRDSHRVKDRKRDRERQKDRGERARDKVKTNTNRYKNKALHSTEKNIKLEQFSER